VLILGLALSAFGGVLGEYQSSPVFPAAYNCNLLIRRGDFLFQFVRLPLILNLINGIPFRGMRWLIYIICGIFFRRFYFISV
jgi:hypothetical protein